MIEWIKKMRETERGRTLLKFILYMIFLVFVFVLVFLSRGLERPNTTSSGNFNSTPNSKESSIETTTITYYTKQEKLLSSNYEFTYTYKGEKNLTYYGKKKDDLIDGLKETDDELTRYTIEDGSPYKITNSIKEEYPDLYDELEKDFFDLKILFQKLNRESAKIEKMNSKKIYYYILEDYTYIITTDETSIRKIEITSELDSYMMEFTY